MANKEDTFVMQDALERYAELDKQRLLGYDEGEGDEKTHVNGVKDDLESEIATAESNAKAYTDEKIGDVDLSGIETNAKAIEGLDGRLTTVEDDYLTSKDKSDLESEITAIPKFKVEVVDSLPTEDISTSTVYLVTGGNVNDNDNMYTEYIYVEHTVDGVTTYTWEKLGEQNFDLADYYTATEVEAKLAEKASASEFETFKQAVTDNADAISDIEDTISDYGTVKSNASSALTQATTNAGNIEELQKTVAGYDTTDEDGNEIHVNGIADNTTAIEELQTDLAGKADASDLANYEAKADLEGDVDEILAGKDYLTDAVTGVSGSGATITVTKTSGSSSFTVNNVAKATEADTAQTANSVEQLNNSLTLEDNDSFSFDGSQPESIPLATESQSGLMSAEDKAFIDAWKNPATTTLENTSWDEIKAEAIKGTARNYWNIGDTKTITLSTGEEITVRIIGFDHDASNSITFEMVGLLSTTYAHHTSNTNAGGWDESDIRSTLNDTIFSQLPNDLQGVVRTVTKKASAGSQSDTITDSQDKLFLLSMAEIFSESAISSSAWSTISDYADVYNAEGSQYEYYKDLLGDFDPDNSTSLLQKQRNGSNYSWWLRSPNRSGSTHFWYFNAGNQYIGHNTASDSYGVAFCFCV